MTPDQPPRGDGSHGDGPSNDVADNPLLETTSCPHCRTTLQAERRFKDDRFQCPQCGGEIRFDQTSRVESADFNPGRVMADMIFGALISMAVISSTIVVLDAFPTFMQARSRGSTAIIVAWAIGSLRRVVILALLSPIPGMVLALIFSPPLHRHGRRWTVAFRAGFVFMGPLMAILTGAGGAIFYWNELGVIPYFYTHGTMAYWLATGYTIGTVCGIAWKWKRWKEQGA